MKVWVRNKLLDIDLIEEINEFSWSRERFVEDKFTACSPFRYDGSPSFFINLENLPDKDIAGTWLDSGALEGSEFRSGNFLTLLAFLRNETEDESFEYLIGKYDFKPYQSKLKLNIGLKVKTEFNPLLEPIGEIDNSYLPSRGISLEVCRETRAIFVKDKNAVAFTWRNPLGEIQAIKYRRTDSKIFYYEKGGKRLNELLFNLDFVTRNKCKTIAITEGEIDALSWLTLGRGAVALGGSSFSDKQLSQLIRTGAENIIISTDSDGVGESLADTLTKKLKGYFKLYKVVYPPGVKDLNEFIQKYPNQQPQILKVNTKF